MAVGSSTGSSGGGGAGGNNIRAGGAYFEVFANDKMSGQLDRMKQKAKAFADSMKKTMKFALGGAVGAIGGGMFGDGPLGKALMSVGGGAAAGFALGGLPGGAVGGAVGGLNAAQDLLMGGIKEAAATKRAADTLGITVELMSKFRRVAEDFGVTVDDVMNDTTGRFAKAIAAARAINSDEAERALQIEKEWADATRDLQAAMLPLVGVFADLTKAAAGFAAKAAGVWGAVGVKMDEIKALAMGGIVDKVVATVMAGAAIVSAPAKMTELLKSSLSPTGVKGSFNTFGAMGQFGFGDTNSEEKKQTELMKQIIALLGGMPDKTGKAIAEKLGMK